MQVLRYLVFAVFVAAGFVALGSWVLRTRRINSFSSLGRFLRTTTEPVIAPVEHWVLRNGGNPQNAGWWLFGLTVVGGIVVLSLAGWLGGQLSLASSAARTPRGIFKLVIYYAGQLVLLAIIVRVIAGWLGAGRYNRWIRPAYLLTDWIIEPLRKVIPPLGMIDITPIVAWFLLQIALRWVMMLL